MSDKIAEMYVEEVTPVNEIKGFTKSFVKRTKDKREEDKNVIELLSYIKEKRVLIGAKITEKCFKNGVVSKVYTASNVDDLTLRKTQHYAKIANVEVVVLDLNNSDLAQKIGKPFLINMVCVRNK